MKDEAGFDTGDLYDAENHLVARVNGDLNVSIVYDHDGNRVAKRRVNLGNSSKQATHYILDDRNPTGYIQVLAEYTTGTGASTPMVTYAYGLDLISQTASTTTHYYGYDGQGSVRMLLDTGVDENTLITDTYDFDRYLGRSFQSESDGRASASPHSFGVGALVPQDEPKSNQQLDTGAQEHSRGC